MANQKINDIAAAGAVTDAMQFETDIGGVTPNRVTALQIKTYCDDNIWARVGTTISPETAGDDLDMGTGTVTATTGIFNGNVEVDGYIKNPTDITFTPQASPVAITDGSMYYDSGSTKFQFRENGAWVSLGDTSIWDRTGTTISPETAGDDLDMGTGDITATEAHFTSKLTVDGAINYPTVITFTAQAVSPVTSDGTIYYNSASTNFQFRENGAWVSLGDTSVWERSGTTISPETAGDDLDMGTGTISAANIGAGVSTLLYTLQANAESTSLAVPLLIENQEGGAASATGIRFKSVGDLTDVRAKGGIFFERTDPGGVGSLHLAVEGTNDDSNADLTDAKLTIDKNGDVSITNDLAVKGNVTIGAGAAGVDYTLTFDGEDNDGVITWLEDEDTFDMSCNLTISTGTLGVNLSEALYSLHVAANSSNLATGLLLDNQTGGAGSATGIRFRASSGEATDIRAKAGIFFERTEAGGVGSLHLAVEGTNDDSNADLTDAKLTIDSDGNVSIRNSTPTLIFNDTSSNIFTIGSLGNDQLDFVNPVVGHSAEYRLFTADGDGTDELAFLLYGVGTAADVTNSEYLAMGYDTGNIFIIESLATGTGTLRNLEIRTGSNGNQILLSSDGNVSMANNLTIGSGAAGVDYTLTFNGEDNDGVITWLEDEDAFDMGSGAITTAGKITGGDLDITGTTTTLLGTSIDTTGGNFTVNGTGAINVATDTNTNTVNLASGTGTRTVNVGGVNTTLDITGYDVNIASVDLHFTAINSKGELIACDGTRSRALAVGNNDEVLTADSTTATGLKWAVAGGSGYWDRTVTTLEPSTAGDDLDMGSGEITTTDTITCGDLYIQGSTPTLRFIDSSSDNFFIKTDGDDELHFSSDVSGSNTFFRFFSKDGDGTDTVAINLFGVGSSGSLTNQESLKIEYNTGYELFQIYSSNTGTGTLQALRLGAGTNVTSSQLALSTDGRVGMTVAAPLAQLHIDQKEDDEAIPVLALDQADISEGFINFIGSDRGVISSGTSSTESVRVEINGAIRRLALYADA